MMYQKAFYDGFLKGEDFMGAEEIGKKIDELLKKMTLEEKTGQLRQCGPSLVGAFEVSFEELLDMMFDGRISKEEFDRLMGTAKQDFREEDLRAGRIGSYNGIGDAETANRLQKIAVEETRLGIPLLFGYDVIHGFRTVTPIPLAESCAWEDGLWERTARLAAEEATAAGVHMTFAPMADVAKDARWGRVSEGAGEDVLLNAHYGASKVRGFQGKELSAPDAMAACVKHFAAYGAVEAGRDYNRVDLSRQKLYEEYLPAYKACIEAGARAVMPAFNDINGVPCSVNKELLRDILREDWGFDGMTVSDANAIAECVTHGIARDKKDAAKQAILAGMDMDMTSDSYHEELISLVESGEVDEKILDEAVSHILRIKFELGLFEHPYRTGAEREREAFLTPEARKLALEAAEKSIVLLKNDGRILPLKKETRIALFGSMAESAGENTGAWAVGAHPEECVSLLEGLQNEKADVRFYGENMEQIKEAAESADVLLAVLGEHKEESGEAASRADIGLHAEQLSLFEELVATEKPVIVLLMNGRPLAIPEIARKASAVIEGWQLGTEAGNAYARILFGETNPSGKLTVTFPYSSGQCPMYYAHINTGRPGGKSKFTSKYLDTPLEPVYPFGFCLSYTEFSYDALSVEKSGAGVTIRISVKNVGDIPGEEVVQCYYSRRTAKRVGPVRKLAAYQKLFLEPGETEKVVFELKKEDLGYYDKDMNYVTDLEDMVFYAGTNSQDTLEQAL